MSTTVSPIEAYAAQTQAAQTSSNASSGQLDQSTFLKLMITQFQNQNPLQPQDPTQMLTQLAQFSTVSGIQNMQTSLSSLSDALKSSHVLDGATLVGHQVLAPGTTATLTSGGTVTGAVDVPTGATAMAVVVTDASGQVVRQFSVPVQSGLTNFTWDGVANDGTQAAAGQYNFSAIAQVGGQNQSLQTLLVGRVGSVTIDPTSQSLTLNVDGMGAVALTDVRQVI